MRRGSSPRLDSLDRICKSLGLEIRLEPSYDVAPAIHSAPTGKARKTLLDQTAILPWLWQGSFIDGDTTLRTILKTTEKLIVKLDAICDMLRKLREKGAISAAEAQRILDAIETGIRRKLRARGSATAKDNQKP